MTVFPSCSEGVRRISVVLSILAFILGVGFGALFYVDLAADHTASCDWFTANAPQKPDYDALAEQARQAKPAVDYDALASQHGGVDITAGLVPKTAEPEKDPFAAYGGHTIGPSNDPYKDIAKPLKSNPAYDECIAHNRPTIIRKLGIASAILVAIVIFTYLIALGVRAVGWVIAGFVGNHR